MRLTQFSDFGLRVLIHLAVRDGGRVTIADVADCYGISRAHLMKVVPELVRHGWVTSERGRRGGLALACAPASISLGDVLRKLEGQTPLVACQQQQKGDCLISPACRLPLLLDEAMEAFYATLDRHTLEDIMQPPHLLRDLLGAPPTSREVGL